MKEFFEPSAVTVVGASREPGKLGNEITKNIIDAGYGGGIYPVNPKADEVLGLRCYRSVKDIPDGVELAVVVVPARFVPSVISDCGVKGIGKAIIVSGGFSETGAAGAELERQLVEAAREAGVRVVGPNCQGVTSTKVRLCASWPLVKTKGSISIVSQSGTILAAIGCWAEADGIGVSKLIALGNKCDVEEVELLEYLEKDEDTKVIGLYLEGIRNGRKFIEVAEKLVRKKPLLVLKGGRTPKGIEAAKSHTRSLAGSDSVFDAVLKRVGAARVHSVEELYDGCKALSSLPPPPGPNVAIVTSSGGSGILATDACEELGLNVVSLPESLGEILQRNLPSECIIQNPLDLTGGATSQMYDEALSVLLPSETIHSVLLIVGDPMPGIAEIVTKYAGSGKPVVPVMLGGGEVERKERAELASMKLPVFPSPTRGAKALAVLARYSSKPKGLQKVF
jgi:acetyl coenzyme A synthetase (ADP forming)-like protein